MSFSLTPEQVAENGLREKAEVEAENKYLQKQLGQLLEERRRGLRNSRSPTDQEVRFRPEGEESHPHGSSSEGEEEGRPFRSRGGNNLDFKVDIPEFEAHLDPDLFLDWVRTIERVFDYKDVSDEKKVKLWPLSSESMPPFGGLMLWPRELERGKPRSVLGIT